MYKRSETYETVAIEPIELIPGDAITDPKLIHHLARINMLVNRDGILTVPNKHTVRIYTK